MPWFTASAASLTSIATVRVTARPGTSARTETSLPSSAIRPNACARVLGRRRRRAFAVVEESAPALAPEPTRVDEVLLDQRRLVTRVVEEAVVDRARDGEIDVVADQVHQLARAHLEATAFA